MSNVWTWLSTPPPTHEIFDWFGTIYIVVFGLGFVLSAYLTGPGAASLTTDPLTLEGIRQWATVGLALFGLGLFFFGIRAIQVNPLSFGAPIWMVGSVIALLVAAVRGQLWWRTIYPSRRDLQAREIDIHQHSSARSVPATPEPNRPVPGS